MPRPSPTIVIDGRTWITVPAAARLLRTTTPKVRDLMAAGILEWQNHPRRREIIVPTDQLLAYRRSDANPNKGKRVRKLLSPDPLAGGLPKLGAEPPRWGNGGLLYSTLTRGGSDDGS